MKKEVRIVAATGHRSESLQVVESCGEKHFSEIPLIAFLIFEESYVPLKSLSLPKSNSLNWDVNNLRDESRFT